MDSDCNDKYNVSVFAYDLSKGLMKTFSKMFLGNFL